MRHYVWSRELAHDYRRVLLVRGERVFLTLGESISGGKASVIELAARPGEQRKIFGAMPAVAGFSLAAPQTWKLPVDAEHGGEVTVAREAEALVVTLRPRDPGRVVLKDFDVVRETGGVQRALVKTFAHVEAGAEMTLELVPRGGAATAGTAPILSGWEVVDEAFTPGARRTAAGGGNAQNH